MANQAPTFTFQLGYVKGVVWPNRPDKRTFYNVTFSRSYKDKHDNWQDGQSFGAEDLPVLAKVLEVCQTWITRQQIKEQNGE